MNAPATVRLMTAEEFLALPDDGIDRDLINGVVREWGVTVTRRHRIHSAVEARLAYLLVSWLNVQPQPRGSVHSGEAGCYLSRNPDVVVGIDVVYISPELAAAQGDDTTMIDGAPTLAVGLCNAFSELGILEKMGGCLSSPDYRFLRMRYKALAVEILSPSTTEEEVNDKLRAYRTARVPLVWLVDPYLRTITLLRPGAEPELFNVNQELTAEPHLPGLRLRVADIFVR